MRPRVPGLSAYATKIGRSLVPAEMFLRGQVPRQFKPGGNEAQNLGAITAELLAKLEQIAKQQQAAGEERVA